jgi:hypothetical protein
VILIRRDRLRRAQAKRIGGACFVRRIQIRIVLKKRDRQAVDSWRIWFGAKNAFTGQVGRIRIGPEIVIK